MVLLAVAARSSRDVMSDAACGRNDVVTRARHGVLLSPVGLVWRLQRGVVHRLGSCPGGRSGSSSGTSPNRFRACRVTRRTGGLKLAARTRIVDAYQVSIIQLAGMFVAIYVVQVLLRMRVDESGGTLEPVLATAVTRARWMWGHVVNVVAGCVALIVLFAISMALTAGQVLGEHAPLSCASWSRRAWSKFPRSWLLAPQSSRSCLPAPRWAVPASWALLLAALVVGPMFGPGLDLPPWVQDLSPFTHSPKAPAAPVAAAPLLALAGLCVGIAAASLSVLRRRDLVLPA